MTRQVVRFGFRFAVVLLLAAPLAAEAQRAEEMPRVGYINPGFPSDPIRMRRLEAFRQGLRELGYAEGRNIALEPRWAEGKYDRYPALAADLVRLKVHVIVAVGGRATQVAQQATKTTPIVMSVVIDPLGSGLVSSLARPGGNVTGLTVMASDLVGKQFELLKQAAPEVSRVALLWNPANPGGRPSCERRKLQRGPWACDFKPWRRGVPRRSTTPSRR